MFIPEAFSNQKSEGRGHKIGKGMKPEALKPESENDGRMGESMKSKL